MRSMIAAAKKVNGRVAARPFCARTRKHDHKELQLHSSIVRGLWRERHLNRNCAVDAEKLPPLERR